MYKKWFKTIVLLVTYGMYNCSSDSMFIQECTQGNIETALDMLTRRKELHLIITDNILRRIFETYNTSTKNANIFHIINHILDLIISKELHLQESTWRILQFITASCNSTNKKQADICLYKIINFRKELNFELSESKATELFLHFIQCNFINTVLHMLAIYKKLKLDIKHSRSTCFEKACQCTDPTVALKMLEMRKELLLHWGKINDGFKRACEIRNITIACKILEIDQESKPTRLYYDGAFQEACEHDNITLPFKMLEMREAKKIDFNMNFAQDYFVFLRALKTTRWHENVKPYDTDKPLRELLSQVYRQMKDYMIHSEFVSNDFHRFTYENTKLIYIFDALKNIDTAPEAHYLEDHFSLTRYTQTKQQLYDAYNYWLTTNDYKRLSDFFVYIPHKIKHYINVIKTRSNEVEKNIELGCDLETATTNAQCYKDILLPSDIYTQPLGENEDLNSTAELCYITKTFFKSIDHILIVLSILAFLESDMAKQSLLYNRILSLHNEYYHHIHDRNNHSDTYNCYNDTFRRMFRKIDLPACKSPIYKGIYYMMYNHEEELLSLLKNDYATIVQSSQEHFVLHFQHILKETMPHFMHYINQEEDMQNPLLQARKILQLLY